MVVFGASHGFSRRSRVNTAVAILGATLFLYLAYSPMAFEQAMFLVPFYFLLSGLNFAFLSWVYKYLGLKN